MRKKENDDEKGREDRVRLHLQLHQGRLPLPAVRLQVLQLLNATGPAPPGAAPAQPTAVGLKLFARYGAATAGEETMAKGQQRSNKEARKPKKAKVKTSAANPSTKGSGGLGKS